MTVRDPDTHDTASDPRTRVTVFGCDADEDVLFRQEADNHGVTLVITTESVSASSIPLAAGSRCISVGHKSLITNEHLDALYAIGVRYISTRSIGFNHVDAAYAASIGMTLGNVGYSPDSVADYTLMLILMAVRNMKSVLRLADLHDYRLNDVRGRELRDLTVGVLGTGRIGAAVIERLQGFGCRVLAFDRQQQASAQYASLDEVLQGSDILTLHTPLDESTHHLLNAKRISELKQGAYIINTGRGALIDTDSLVAALDSGRLGGVALDVVEGEDGIFYNDHSDTAHDNELLAQLQSLPNAIITPHTAYYTDHALSDTVINSLINCSRFAQEPSND